MILGNKCDMNDRRQVSKERGEQVSAATNCKNVSFGVKFLQLKREKSAVRSYLKYKENN